MNVARELLLVARELIAVKRLDERDNLEREIKKAIKDGDTVEFLYTKKDGSQKKREITPTAVFEMKGRPAVKGVEVNDRRGIEKVFYLDMVGNIDNKDEAALADAEAPVVIDAPSGFYSLTDKNLALSAASIAKKGGLWASEKQGRFIIGKLRRGNKVTQGEIVRRWKGDAVGTISFPMGSRNAEGFAGTNVYVIDGKGVVARYYFWERDPAYVETWEDRRLMDIYDDFGNKFRNMPPDLQAEVRELEKTVDSRGQYKSGYKLKWTRD